MNPLATARCFIGGVRWCTLCRPVAAAPAETLRRGGGIQDRSGFGRQAWQEKGTRCGLEDVQLIWDSLGGSPFNRSPWFSHGVFPVILMVIYMGKSLEPGEEVFPLPGQQIQESLWTSQCIYTIVYSHYSIGLGRRKPKKTLFRRCSPTKTIKYISNTKKQSVFCEGKPRSFTLYGPLGGGLGSQPEPAEFVQDSCDVQGPDNGRSVTRAATLKAPMCSVFSSPAMPGECC